MTPDPILRFPRAAVAAALLGASALSLAADAPKDARPDTKNAIAAAPSSGEAVFNPIDRAPAAPMMIVVRDAETGLLRPATAEEARRLREKESAIRTLTSRSGEGVTVRRKTDGSLVADVTGRFENLAVARRVNGKVEQTCMDDPAGATSFLASERAGAKATPARPGTPEEK